MAEWSNPSDQCTYSYKHLPDWKPADLPTREPIIGRSCKLEILTVGHTDDLWAAISLDKEQKLWNYLPYGPFKDLEAYRGWVEIVSQEVDNVYYAVVDNQGSIL